MIAAKYEEIYPPELKDFVFITDNAFSKQDVLMMEFQILSALDFAMTFPTSFRFLQRYIKVLGEDRKVYNFAWFLLELSLLNLQMY